MLADQSAEWRPVDRFEVMVSPPVRLLDVIEKKGGTRSITNMQWVVSSNCPILNPDSPILNPELDRGWVFSSSPYFKLVDLIRTRTLPSHHTSVSTLPLGVAWSLELTHRRNRCYFSKNQSWRCMQENPIVPGDIQELWWAFLSRCHHVSLHLNMWSNCFLFGDTTFWLWEDGTAMVGTTPPAPSCATLYYDIFGLQPLQEFENVLLYLQRFIDDQFGVWMHDADPLLDQQQWLALEDRQRSLCSLE